MVISFTMLQMTLMSQYMKYKCILHDIINHLKRQIYMTSSAIKYAKLSENGYIGIIYDIF